MPGSPALRAHKRHAHLTSAESSMRPLDLAALTTMLALITAPALAQTPAPSPPASTPRAPSGPAPGPEPPGQAVPPEPGSDDTSHQARGSWRDPGGSAPR